MIKENVEKILRELPEKVKLVVATKKIGVGDIEEAIKWGVKIIGENYIKETEEKYRVIGNKVKWHLIGHLQKNKVKRAVKLFDVIETIDSIELAQVLDRECEKINKIMPVLLEVNVARESQKSGVLPEKVEDLLKEILSLKNVKLMGLMTMGPLVDNPESIRPFFKRTKEIFDKIKSSYKDRLEWVYLSMGMSDTYRIAIQEGANLIRIGTAIFGPKR